MAKLAINALPLRQLDSDLRSGFPRREELWEILLLSSDLSIRCTDLVTDSRGYSEWRD